jgi:hypothetical protein
MSAMTEVRRPEIGDRSQVSVEQAKGLIEMALRPAFGRAGSVARSAVATPGAITASDRMISNLVELGVRTRRSKLAGETADKSVRAPVNAGGGL